MIAKYSIAMRSNRVNNERISIDQYKLLLSGKKIDSSENKGQAKYRNVKVEYQGMKFDSEGEMNRWCELLILQRDGKITDLQRQVRITVFEGSTYQLSIHWIPDFCYTINAPDGKKCVEDFKSPITAKKPDFRIKVKLFKKLHPNFLVYISTKKGVVEWK